MIKIAKKYIKLILREKTVKSLSKNIKIIKIKILKIIEYFNIFIFSDPYKIAYKAGRIDKNYKAIESFIDFNNGIYFEIGALDGYFSSPSYSLSVKRNWQGVMVDGNENFLDLIRLYRPKDEIVHAACTSDIIAKKNNTCNFIDLHHSGEIYFSNDQIDKYSKEKIRELGNKIIKKNVPLTTVTKIIEKSKIIKNNFIDLFILDVEGHEMEVLEGYNFSKIHTKYFLIESRTDNERMKINEFMKKNDYNCVGQTSSTDYLYLKIK